MQIFYCVYTRSVADCIHLSQAMLADESGKLPTNKLPLFVHDRCLKVRYLSMPTHDLRCKTYGSAVATVEKCLRTVPLVSDVLKIPDFCGSSPLQSMRTPLSPGMGVLSLNTDHKHRLRFILSSGLHSLSAELSRPHKNIDTGLVQIPAPALKTILASYQSGAADLLTMLKSMSAFGVLEYSASLLTSIYNAVLLDYTPKADVRAQRTHDKVLDSRGSDSTPNAAGSRTRRGSGATPDPKTDKPPPQKTKDPPAKAKASKKDIPAPPQKDVPPPPKKDVPLPQPAQDSKSKVQLCDLTPAAIAQLLVPLPPLSPRVTATNEPEPRITAAPIMTE